MWKKGGGGREAAAPLALEVLDLSYRQGESFFKVLRSNGCQPLEHNQIARQG